MSKIFKIEFIKSKPRKSSGVKAEDLIISLDSESSYSEEIKKHTSNAISKQNPLLVSKNSAFRPYNWVELEPP